MSHFKMRDRVRYVPNHAHGDPKHPDCETGDVTSIGASGTVFVLFENRISSQGCYPDSLVLLDRILEQRCVRGHTWLATQLEWESYKGALPLPCPICAREGLRDRAGA